MNYVHLKSSGFPSGLLRHKFPFLGAVAKLRKIEYELHHVSIYPHGMTQLPLDEFP